MALTECSRIRWRPPVWQMAVLGETHEAVLDTRMINTSDVTECQLTHFQSEDASSRGYAQDTGESSRFHD